MVLAFSRQTGRTALIAQTRKIYKRASGSRQGQEAEFPSNKKTVPPACTSSRNNQRPLCSKCPGKVLRERVSSESANGSSQRPRGALCTPRRNQLIHRRQFAYLLALIAIWAASHLTTTYSLDFAFLSENKIVGD